jgi:hypothetical protein
VIFCRFWLIFYLIGDFLERVAGYLNSDRRPTITVAVLFLPVSDPDVGKLVDEVVKQSRRRRRRRVFVVVVVVGRVIVVNRRRQP